MGSDTIPTCVPTEPMFVYIALASAVFTVGGMMVLASMATRFTSPVDRLISAVIVIFAGMAGVWVVDNILFVNRSLLSENESSDLLNIISMAITLVLGYYFGRRSSDSIDKED